ncbi:MAG: hypothetical protein ACRDPL_03190, partial [Propionibacteriaceae bacterium]
IKVMNLVSLLIAPAVVAMSPLSTTPNAARYAIAGVALAIIITMVTISTRREVAIASEPDQAQIEGENPVQVPIEQTESKVDKLAQ